MIIFFPLITFSFDWRVIYRREKSAASHYSRWTEGILIECRIIEILVFCSIPSEHEELSQVANKISKWNKAKCLKRGKMCITRWWLDSVLFLVGWDQVVSSPTNHKAKENQCKPELLAIFSRKHAWRTVNNERVVTKTGNKKWRIASRKIKWEIEIGKVAFLYQLFTMRNKYFSEIIIDILFC